MHWSKNQLKREETIRKMSLKLKGRISPNKGKSMSIEHREKLSNIKREMAERGELKGLFTSNTGKGREKTFFKEKHKVYWNMLSGRKSHNEFHLENLMNENSLPYKFVGDGKVIFDRINPDFINCNGKKKVIELQSGITKEWKERRNRIYAKYGYSWIIIPLQQLKSHPDKVIEKIRRFDEE